jgi:multidrug efflux pump subunit AcrA (membrane-fusion protein)
MLVALLVVGVMAGVLLALRSRRANPTSGAVSGTVKAERRTFLHTLRVTGTLEAVRSHSVLAPRLAGSATGAMVVTKLVRTGERVKQGDLLAEFDRQSQIKNLLDKQAEYRDLLNQIQEKQAEQAAARTTDETDLKQAENDVGTAKLEMQKNEVVSRIDAEKNGLALEEAEARLKQLRQTFDLKRRAAEAELGILETKRDRAHSAMLHAQENAETMSIRAPLDGLVVLNSIWKGTGTGEVQEGDQVWPGMPFMQVVDTSSMIVRVRVNQMDVPYLRVGQSVQVRLDAYPDLAFPGRLDQLAAIGLGGLGDSGKVRAFGAIFSIRGSDPKLMPDLTAAVDVELERLPDVLVVPREAVVMKDGKSWVWVKGAMGYEKRAVKVGARSDVEVVIDSGLESGVEIERNPGGAASGLKA